MAQQNMPFFGGAQQEQTAAQQQATLTEKDMADDMLSCHKALANSYSVLILEGSIPQLRSILMDNWQQTVTDQYVIFDQMRAHGWYQLPQAQPQEIESSKQQFAQVQTQLH